jgi:hypothetical protein
MVPVGGSMAVVVVVVDVTGVLVPEVVVVPEVLGVPVVVVPSATVSRVKAVPWRNPDTTALACSSPPRNSANSALSFASVLVEVPMAVVVVPVVVEEVAVVVVEELAVVVVDVVSVSAAWATEKAAARQPASRVKRVFGCLRHFMVCLLG